MEPDLILFDWQQEIITNLELVRERVKRKAQETKLKGEEALRSRYLIPKDRVNNEQPLSEQTTKTNSALHEQILPVDEATYK